MLRILAGLLLIPLLDALLLVAVATWIGAVPTVALVVLSALLGVLLVRAEGRHTMRKIQRKLAAGEPPTDELLDGALLLVAAAFLLTPGLVTDAIGLLLVVPLTRYPIRVAAKKWVVVPYADAKGDGFVTGNVYVGGFPGGGGAGPGGQSQGGTVDVDQDDYDFDSSDDGPSGVGNPTDDDGRS